MIFRLQQFNKIIRYCYAYCVILVICHIIQISSQVTSRTIFVSDNISIANLSIEAAAMNQFQYLNSTKLFQIKVLRHNSRTYLFAVSEGFLLQIDPHKFTFINKFQPPYSLSSSSSSSSSSLIRITYLSNIVSNERSLVYFCFISQSASSASVISSQSECTLVDSKLYIPILWGPRKFVSPQISRDHKASPDIILQAGRYTFSGYTTQVYQDELQGQRDGIKIRKLAIFRTLTPQIYANSQYRNFVLNTPRAAEYFENNSEFVGAFLSHQAVYYMVTEPVSWQSVSMKASCNSYQPPYSAHRTVSIVTRLVRICIDDHGGIPDLNPHNFATIAKTDIVCPVNNSTYLLTKAISLEFDLDTGRLLVLFGDQLNGPVSTVLCSYNIKDIEAAFDGDVITSNVDPLCLNNRNYIIKRNPLPSICQKLTNKLLTEKELLIASQLSVNSLYRSTKIYPINHGPIIELGFNSLPVNTLTNWLGIKSIKILVDDGSIQIILIFSTDKLVLYSECLDKTAPKFSNWLCHEETFYSETEIVGVDNIIMKSHVWVFIATKSGKIYKLEILETSCRKYSTDEMNCINHAPWFCGWLSDSGSRGQCLPWSSSFQEHGLSWKRSNGLSKNLKKAFKSNHGEICALNDNGMHLKCRCFNYCDEKRCKVQVTNCEGTIELYKSTFPSSNWTKCTLESVRKRERHCKSKQNCIGKYYEFESCPTNQLKEYKSVWTDWNQNPGKLNEYERYRAICRINRTQVSSHVEKGVSHRNPNHKPGRHIQETSRNNKWSEWSACMSHNIRYRLLSSCYSIDKCPRDSIRVKPCSNQPPSSHYKAVINTPQNQYETIHIIIAILGCSIIWLSIIVILIIIFYRLYSNPSQEEIPRRLHRRKSDASSATYNNISLVKTTQRGPKLPPQINNPTIILPSRQTVHSPPSNKVPPAML